MKIRIRMNNGDSCVLETKAKSLADFISHIWGDVTANLIWHQLDKTATINVNNICAIDDITEEMG